MGEFNTQSNKYLYTPYKHTTDEILWVGGDIACLGICNNTKLTLVESQIAQKVCDLITATDASDLVLPDCLIVAWNSKDKTILEFIKFLLDEYCNQQVINTNLQNEINNANPQITLSYCCCNDETGCNTQVTLTLSDHLQKILNCLCIQSDRITQLESIIGDEALLPSGQTVVGLLLQVQSIANTANTNATNWIANKASVGSTLTLPIPLI